MSDRPNNKYQKYGNLGDDIKKLKAVKRKLKDDILEYKRKINAHTERRKVTIERLDIAIMTRKEELEKLTNEKTEKELRIESRLDNMQVEIYKRFDELQKKVNDIEDGNIMNGYDWESLPTPYQLFNIVSKNLENDKYLARLLKDYVKKFYIWDVPSYLVPSEGINNFIRVIRRCRRLLDRGDDDLRDAENVIQLLNCLDIDGEKAVEKYSAQN